MSSTAARSSKEIFFQDVSNALTSAGIFWWLDCGSLLRLVRDGDLFLSYDLDLGMWAEDVGKLRSLESALKNRYRLCGQGQTNISEDLVKIIPKESKDDNYPHVDLYIYSTQDDVAYRKNWHKPHKDSTFSSHLNKISKALISLDSKRAWVKVAKEKIPYRVRFMLFTLIDWFYKLFSKTIWFVIPLSLLRRFEMTTILDTPVRVPVNASEYLHWRYGASWMVRNPSWSLLDGNLVLLTRYFQTGCKNRRHFWPDTRPLSHGRFVRENTVTKKKIFDFDIDDCQNMGFDEWRKLFIESRPRSKDPLFRRAIFYLSDLDGGGAQRTTVNLVNELHRRGLDVHLVVARTGGEAEKWIEADARVINLEVKRARYSVLKLRRVIKELKPDVVFSTMVNANIVASMACVALRKRISLVLRETNSHRARGDLTRFQQQLIGWSYRRADAVVALSEGVRRELIADYHLLSSRVRTIGNPVKISDFSVGQNMGHDGLAMKFDDDLPLILAMGRLTYQKGFDLLIEAFSRVKTPSRLVILGEGPDRAKLESLISKLELTKRVFLPGFVESSKLWLQQASLFVLSSRWEGFGHVLVEAMASGVPVLSTNCPHGPADIIVDGETGILVETGNVDALVLGIDRALSEGFDRQVMVDKARERSREYDSLKISTQYLTLFDGLAR